MRISELILDDKNEIDGIVGTINLISKKNINKATMTLTIEKITVYF